MDKVHEINKPQSGWFPENQPVALRCGVRMCSLWVRNRTIIQISGL